ncbi:MAG: hypothetical protein II938_02655 [Alphaproteobacteria bacterium]|nr:hypothetical protein [Alphaproteobacteria bacterium]
MAPYLFWELIILIVGVWLMAVLFFVYGWLLLKRQKQMMAQFLPPQTPSAESKEPEAPVHLEISKDEPLSKYKDLTPEEADVSFVDKDE